MKIITIGYAHGLREAIEPWVGMENKNVDDERSITLNLPEWILQIIHKKQYETCETASRSEFIRHHTWTYINYLKTIFPEAVKIAPSRSEFIRHALMRWYYQEQKLMKTIEKTKKKEVNLTNGMKLDLNNLKTVRLE